MFSISEPFEIKLKKATHRDTMNLSLSTTSPFTSNSSNSWLPFSLHNSTTAFSDGVVSPNQTTCTDDAAAFRWILAVFYLLFFIFGLVGNLFALWVFLSINTSRNSVRVFLINCAVADLVLLACLPFRIFFHINGNRWVLGYVACKIVGNLFYMNMYISITLLGCISLDRYLRLKGKSRVRRGLRVHLWGHSWPWSWVVCTGLWGFSLVGLVPMIATAEDNEYKDECFQYRPRRQDGKGKAYFNAVLVVMFWLIFVTMMVSYAKVAAQLLKASREKPDLPNAQRYQRTAKKSFFVLFLFTICFGPYHAFRPFYIISQLNNNSSCDYVRLVDRTNEVMLLFSAFNSCLDPVMYFLLSGSVRKMAFRSLGNKLGTRSVNATSNSSTIDYRRQSAQCVLPNTELNSITPQSSNNNTLRKASLVTAPSAGQKQRL